MIGSSDLMRQNYGTELHDGRWYGSSTSAHTTISIKF
jgi:hypothetical protein